MAEISRLLNSRIFVRSRPGLDLSQQYPLPHRQGHKNYSEDLLQASLDPALRVKDETGKLVPDSKKFLDENLTYANGLFDVACAGIFPTTWKRAWSNRQLSSVVSDETGGLLLVFFSYRDAGPDAPCYRFHITGTDMLETQEVRLTGSGGKQIPRLQRVFNNRNIENLFRDLLPSSSSSRATPSGKFSRISISRAECADEAGVHAPQNFPDGVAREEELDGSKIAEQVFNIAVIENPLQARNLFASASRQADLLRFQHVGASDVEAVAGRVRASVPGIEKRRVAGRRVSSLTTDDQLSV